MAQGMDGMPPGFLVGGKVGREDMVIRLYVILLLLALSSGLGGGSVRFWECWKVVMRLRRR